MSLSLLFVLAAAPSVATSSSADPKLANAIVSTAKHVLQKKKAHVASKKLKILQAKHPRPESMMLLRGIAELLGGHAHGAKRWLKKSPDASLLWYAMAESTAVGGLSRANQKLARRARSKTKDPAAKFFAALAWSRAGEDELAHSSLKSALQESEGALDPMWAPDLAYGLVEGIREAVKGLGDEAAIDLELAEFLLANNRRAGALALAKKLDGSSAHRDAANLLRAKAWLRIDPREAERFARRSKLADARVIEAEAMLARDAEPVQVRKRLAAMTSVSDALRPRAAVVIARLLLREGDDAGAMDAARQAYRKSPDAPWAIAVYARALLANDDAARAQEMAKKLLKKRPLEPNPFHLLADIQKLRGQGRDLPTTRLRAQAHDKAVAALRGQRLAVEKVFAAVRDADAARDAAGLDPLRSKHPQAALAVDLALARWGRPGTQRAARERILAQCAPHARNLLSNREGTEVGSVPIRFYGSPVTATVVFSGADPGRCAAGSLRLGQ